MKFFTDISTKKIFFLLGIGIFFSVSASLLISFASAELVGKEIESRDLEFLFGALETGPLAIAKLQSASISQESLDRIMSNPKFEERGIEKVEILGGENKIFSFAKWKKNSDTEGNCLVTTSRIFHFPDSINPFEISVSKNSCFIIKEKKLIFWYSGLTSLLTTLISIFLVVISVWPVGSSIRQAESLLSGETRSNSKIKFTPIKKLVEIAQRSRELEKGKALADLARQVAHDIQSPLSVLNLVLHNLNVPSEKFELLNGSAQRINEIAQSMLSKSRSSEYIEITPKSKHSQTPELKPNTSIVPVVESLIHEKKIEFEEKTKVHIELEVLDYNLKSQMTKSNLSRILSNLINNAVESIESKGIVKVNLKACDGFSVITITDNGAGIPDNFIHKVGEKGATFGKENGNGLGFYNAKKLINQIGGKIEIDSILNKGTTVTVSLPLIS